MTAKKLGKWVAAVGVLVFALGWSFGIYFLIDPGPNTRYLLLGATQNRMATFLTFGVNATFSAGVLWGVAAYLLTRQPPSSD